MKIEVKGLFAVNTALTKLNRHMERESRRRLLEAGRLVQSEARARAPQDMGTLANNIKIKRGSDYVDVGHMGGAIRKYAYVMHEGYYKLGAGSRAKQASLGVEVGPYYIDRGLEDNESEIEKILGHGVKIVVDRWNGQEDII